MVKIWVKTNLNKKITKSEIFVFEGKYEEARFEEYVREICNDMDIPTPVVLSSHVSAFTRYNISRFKKGDFVESVDFDELSLENCKV